MKKIFLIIFSLIVTSSVIAQAKKPTIMVVPADVWCTENGYMMEFDNQGSVKKIPNYKKAFQENSDLLGAISKINELMSERGFPLKNMESVLKSLENNSAEDALMQNKGGSESSESPIDMIKKVAKADIIMQLHWTLKKTGPKKTLNYILQGFDAYTNKQVAGSSGAGAPSFSAEVTVLLEEAVLTHIDNFNNQLQSHFDDLFENGREVTIRIRKWDDWSEDLETEFGSDGDELGFIIEDWVADNTVKGRFSTTDATENMMLFEQVRIPLYYMRNGRERAMDTRSFARNLSSFLKKEPYNIVNKITTKGLGEATIYLGSK